MPSVSDILRKRLDSADPWMLALVQREAVWDEFRIARLLDSLLRHYPVGTLVLCEISAGVRRSEAVSLGHPVIPVLDGFVG
jgi:hypothetical protein